MTQTKPKAQRAWAILAGSYIPCDCIARTRAEAIKKFCEIYFANRSWQASKRRGYRAVRVTITVEEE